VKIAKQVIVINNTSLAIAKYIAKASGKANKCVTRQRIVNEKVASFRAKTATQKYPIDKANPTMMKVDKYEKRTGREGSRAPDTNNANKTGADKASNPVIRDIRRMNMIGSNVGGKRTAACGRSV